jgi:protocatechuate 3,4-dioxygenase beta subunit
LVDGSYVDTGVTTVTDSAGHYKFSGEYLEPGTYRVVETQPSGYLSVGDAVGTVDGSPRGAIETKDILTSINLDGGEDSINNNYFETLPASLSGHVYHDADNDGVYDTSESPIAGVTVKLLDSSGNETGQTTTTDSTGYYQFIYLMPGTYGVVEVQPSGYLDGLDAAGTAGGTALNPGDKITGATLLGGQSGENYDFGELLPCSLSGRVFLDLNGNATYDPTADTLLAGVTIRLLDGTGNLITTTTTDDNGDYAFTNLAPGVYSVSEVQPDYLQGDSLLGSLGGTRVTEDLMKSITIPSGVDAIRYDFYELPPASLSGFVYVDADNDGVFDNEESPIGGATVTLLDASGSSTGRTTVTDSSGYYSFTELEPGTYGVAETQPTGYLDGLDTAGTVGGTAYNPGDKIDQIILSAGDKAKNYNFGELRPASISGKVFVDLDADNAYDAGETLLSGVTMRLLDSQGNEVATVKTGSDGTYAFNNLYPGQYSVVEEQPANYLQGGDQVGTVGTETRGALSGYDKITSITLGQSEDGVNYDFWEVLPAKISGYVFQDGPTIQLKEGESLPSIPSIRDGILTSDDTRLAGITLRLCDGLGNTLYDDYGNEITTVTDQNGYYEFANLRPGSYSVVEVMPTGYIAGVDTAGSLGGYVVNAYSSIPADKAGIWAVTSDGNSIVQIQLESGSEGTEYNFSVVKVEEVPPYYPPPTPPDINYDFPRSFPSGEQGFYHPPYVPQSINVPMAAGGGAGGPGGTTWHLSIINGGQPRSTNEGDEFTAFANAEIFDPNTWKGEDLNQGGQWTVADQDGQVVKTYQYGLYDSIPVVGDWNGDGVTDIAVFLGGYWFIDLNGNGQWDENDLWAKLGQDGDQPVAGDWDGDGKADIGIFGPAWIGDRKAIESEPGLPDSLNLPKNRFKNVPPDAAHATIGYRSMKRTMAGKFRSDLIDHVFEYGTAGDRAVVGDWTGTGIKKIGIFRNGTWYLDIDGDGRWSAADVKLEFGREGDLPVVGDWTGDGVTKLGVYRAGTFVLDTNSNRELDATDKVFELGSAGDKPFAGDFDGKGIDTVGVYHDAQPKIQVPKSAIRSINAK